MNDKNILKANFNLGFTYTRSTGPIIGHFLTCLQSCKIVGIRNSQGKVIMPPAEFDSETGEELSEFIELKNVVQEKISTTNVDEYLTNVVKDSMLRYLRLFKMIN